MLTQTLCPHWTRHDRNIYSLSTVDVDKATVTNHLNFVSIHHKRGISLLSGICRVVLSRIHCRQHHWLYEFYCILSRRAACARCRHGESHSDAREHWIPFTSVSICACNDTYAPNYVKMHVSASILVNTVAYVLGEGKQLRKKMDV